MPPNPSPAVTSRPASPGSGAGPAFRIPGATYRVQFNRRFTFTDALAAVEYWRELGVTDCYASPLFLARPESTHGYDVCGFGRLSPELGSRGDFDEFAGQLRESGLGLLLDMVPNHMGNALSNDWWRNVLEEGADSPYANWFDINWHSAGPEAAARVVLPTLEAPYAQVLESGKLQIGYEEGRFSLNYYDRKFPLSPASLARLAAELRAAGVKPAPGPEMEAALKEPLRALNGQVGEPRSFDRLHALVQQQHYRLAFWRVGPEEINYRRFFDVTDLISLRMERPDVFAATHELVFELLKAGLVTGLRIDHPDGLWDPKQYFERLQTGFRQLSGADQPSSGRLYVVVEKILMRGEPLPEDWPVAGTTGYDYLNQLNRLFVAAANRQAFDAIYRAVAGEQVPFSALVRESKKQILESALISELTGLTRRLKAVAERTRYGQDFTYRQLHGALAEVIAGFPVYRTYFTEMTTVVSEPAQTWVRQAGESARGVGIEAGVLDFIQDLLLLRPPADLDEAGRGAAREFVLRFQQLTGPVMAKGLEDTAFYRFNRLVSLNEVGGDPDGFGTTLEQFHAEQTARLAHWPGTLLATATHDTKRGEDVRARLNILSEMPQAWRQAVVRWQELNTEKKTLVRGGPAPAPNDEYLLYQTLVGAWPPGADSTEGWEGWRGRVVAYMLKALKEGKARTSWTQPDAEYEAAMTRFVEAVLESPQANRFLQEFRPFQRQVAQLGLVNSLAQVLLKMTSPGVPDFYQGTELWDFSLVDPDNRRPIDYSLRRRLLAEVREQASRSVREWCDWLEQSVKNEAAVMRGDSGADLPRSGQLKLALIWRTLQFRQSRRGLFERGDYLPLFATEAGRERVCAFARVLDGQAAIVLVPRLVVGLAGESCRWPVGNTTWRNSALCLPAAVPGGPYRNVLTGELMAANGSQLPIADALKVLPVGVFECGRPAKD